MAPNFKFCSVLWIAVAVIAAHTVVLTEAATLIPTTTTTTTTTAVPDPCSSNPCGKGSTCEARANKGFVCLCLAGDTLCTTTKPNVVRLLDKSLGSDPTYIQSTVLELRPAANSQLRPLTGVNASVEIIYSPESDITASDVVAEVQKATERTDGPLTVAIFVDEDLCARNPCDVNSTRCSSKDGTFNCTCLNGYVPTEFCTRLCLAAPGTTTAATGTTTAAPGTTTAAPGTTTAAPGTTTAAPVTVCPPGQHLVESTCKNCPFGYTGFNCQDGTMMILVIVGSVLGGLLLIALILLIAVLSKLG